MLHLSINHIYTIFSGSQNLESEVKERESVLELETFGTNISFGA